MVKVFREKMRKTIIMRPIRSIEIEIKWTYGLEDSVSYIGQFSPNRSTDSL